MFMYTIYVYHIVHLKLSKQYTFPRPSKRTGCAIVTYKIKILLYIVETVLMYS